MKIIDFTGAILRIDSALVIDNSRTLEYWLLESKDLHRAVGVVNHFHSYFHFEQSNLCLHAAKICEMLQNEQMEIMYLEKAIFQDHLNHEALRRLAKFSSLEIENSLVSALYDSHIKYEADFLRHSVGNFLHCEKIVKLDGAISSYEEGDIMGALKLVDEMNEGSHRLLLLKANINIHLENYELALSQVDRALLLIEESHKQYHRVASIVYQLRAKEYEDRGLIELAKNDMIKARDLNPAL